jgi:uncharacterized protein YlxW (UPF0749 family)
MEATRVRFAPTARTISVYAIFFLAFFLFGYAIMGQFKAASERAALETLSVGELSALYGELASELGQTRLSYFELKTRLSELERQSKSQAEITEELKKEIEQLAGATGMRAVYGPGVRVTITYAKNSLSVSWLIDLINELRAAQAEALAINGKRLVATSAFDETGGRLTLDGEELASPLVIDAIGDPETLKSALTMSGGIIEALSSLEGVAVSVDTVDEVTLPASGAPRQKYIKPLE